MNNIVGATAATVDSVLLVIDQVVEILEPLRDREDMIKVMLHRLGTIRLELAQDTCMPQQGNLDEMQRTVAAFKDDVLVQRKDELLDQGVTDQMKPTIATFNGKLSYFMDLMEPPALLSPAARVERWEDDEQSVQSEQSVYSVHTAPSVQSERGSQSAQSDGSAQSFVDSKNTSKRGSDHELLNVAQPVSTARDGKAGVVERLTSIETATAPVVSTAPSLDGVGERWEISTAATDQDNADTEESSLPTADPVGLHRVQVGAAGSEERVLLDVGRSLDVVQPAARPAVPGAEAFNQLIQQLKPPSATSAMSTHVAVPIRAAPAEQGDPAFAEFFRVIEDPTERADQLAAMDPALQRRLGTQGVMHRLLSVIRSTSIALVRVKALRALGLALEANGPRARFANHETLVAAIDALAQAMQQDDEQTKRIAASLFLLLIQDGGAMMRVIGDADLLGLLLSYALAIADRSAEMDVDEDDLQAGAAALEVVNRLAHNDAPTRGRLLESRHCIPTLVHLILVGSAAFKAKASMIFRWFLAEDEDQAASRYAGEAGIIEVVINLATDSVAAMQSGASIAETSELQARFDISIRLLALLSEATENHTQMFDDERLLFLLVGCVLPTDGNIVAEGSSVVAAALRTMQHLATNNVEMRNAIGVFGLIPALLQAIAVWEDEAFATDAAKVLAVISTEEANRTMIQDTRGGIHTLVSMLQHRPCMSASLASTLGNLAMQDDAARAAIGDAGGIEILRGLLGSNNQQQVEIAMHALLSIVLHDASLERLAASDGSARALLKVLTRGTPDAKSDAAWTIRMLAANNAAFNQQIAQVGGIPMLVGFALASRDAQRDAAVRAIAECARLAANREHFAANGTAISGLLILLNQCNDELRPRVDAILQQVAASGA